LAILVVAKAKAKSECTNFALASGAAFTAVYDIVVGVVVVVFSIYYPLLFLL